MFHEDKIVFIFFALLKLKLIILRKSRFLEFTIYKADTILITLSISCSLNNIYFTLFR